MRADPGEDRKVVLAVAAVAFAAIFVFRLAYGDEGDAITVLYVVPIALIAVRFGLWAGLGAALIATVLVALWVLIDDVDLGPAGFASRGVAFVVAAGVIGFLEERMRGAQARRHALQVHDDILQQLTVVRYGLEHAENEKARAALDEAISNARALVEAELPGEVAAGDLRRL